MALLPLTPQVEKQEEGQATERRMLPQVGNTGGPRLSDECFRLADIAEPPNMGRIYEDSLLAAFFKDQMDAVGKATGLPTVTRNPKGEAQGVSLTGWMAMLGMTAMIVVVFYGLFAAYKRMRGVPDHDYTLVVKSQPK
jgi:Golgi apparatus protein 1